MTIPNLTNEQMLHLLKEVRRIAWISFADDRTIEEKNAALRKIQVLTRDVGND